MNSKTILLSGAHGVGKGFYLRNTLSKCNAFTILEASKLISQYKKADDAGYKKVIDVSDNQQVLLTALTAEQLKITGTIILDGHLCILNASEEIENIPENFLKKASICGIILLQDEPQNIIKRQSERDGSELEYNIIKMIQQKELEYCEDLLSKYSLPYNIIKPTCSYQEFIKIINEM